MTNVPRNHQTQTGRGAAGTGARDDAKPVPADAPGKASSPDILAGLDAFSRRIDEEQKAHERAEAERPRKEEEEARRRGEAERVRQAQMRAQRKSEAEKQNEGRRFAALDMLRKQAASRPAGEDTASRRAQPKPPTPRTLPPASHYLADFAKELNGVLPTTESPYRFIYLQRASPMVLSG